MARLLVAVAVTAYVFFATILLANGIVGSLWVVGYWIVLLPVAIAGGWCRVRPTAAGVAFVILTIIQYVAVTIATGSSFNGAAQESAWYTPILTILVFGGLICLLNVVPIGVLFIVGTLLRGRFSVP